MYKKYNIYSKFYIYTHPLVFACERAWASEVGVGGQGGHGEVGVGGRGGRVEVGVGVNVVVVSVDLAVRVHVRERVVMVVVGYAAGGPLAFACERVVVVVGDVAGGPLVFVCKRVVVMVVGDATGGPRM